VIQQQIPVSQAQFDAVQAAQNSIGVNNPMDNVLYGFPGQNAERGQSDIQPFEFWHQAI